MTTKERRNMRAQAGELAHMSFDRLWESERMPRQEAYTQLVRALGMAEGECHLCRMKPKACREVVSDNKIDNYTNGGGLCFNSLFLTPATGVSDPNVSLSVDNNYIRGRNSVVSGAQVVPCVINAANYPYEYYNGHVINTGILNRADVIARGNTVITENALGTCPTIYFLGAPGALTDPSQQPYWAAHTGPPVNNNAGSTSNFATFYSPALWW